MYCLDWFPQSWKASCKDEKRFCRNQLVERAHTGRKTVRCFLQYSKLCTYVLHFILTDQINVRISFHLCGAQLCAAFIYFFFPSFSVFIYLLHFQLDLSIWKIDLVSIFSMHACMCIPDPKQSFVWNLLHMTDVRIMYKNHVFFRIIGFLFHSYVFVEKNIISSVSLFVFILP